jgi:molecular chaperone GrpE
MQSSRGIDADDQPAAAQRPEYEEALTAPESEEADPSVELAQIEDRYRRALADLDNYRKRSVRELDRRVDEAREAVLHDWLDVVDSVERAMQMETDGPCREGLQAVLAQIDAVLQRHGVRRIGAQGERFDPVRQEAVATRTSADVPDRTVLEVQRSGYARGEHVIRPAQVVVARAGDHAS